MGRSTLRNPINATRASVYTYFLYHNKQISAKRSK